MNAKLNEVKTEKGYFRNSPKFGRTTKLVIRGEIVLEVMGCISRRALLAQFQNQLARN